MSINIDSTIELNRLAAAQLGWTPANFGCTDFDADLVEAIEKYQDYHLLPITGVCDGMTWVTLVCAVIGADDYRRGVKYWKNIMRRGKRRILRACGLDPAVYLDPNRIGIKAIRDRVFHGPLVWVRTPDEVDRATQRGAKAIICETPFWFDPPPGIKKFLQWELIPGNVIDQGDQFVREWETGRWDGVIVFVPYRTWLWDLRFSDWHVRLRSFTEVISWTKRIPRALMVELRYPIEYWIDAVGMHIGHAFDTIMPVVPTGLPPRLAPEWWIKCLQIYWYKYGQVSSRRLRYVITPDPRTTPNDIVRMRSYLRDQEYNVDCGYRGPAGPLEDAFWADLPDRMVRLNPINEEDPYYGSEKPGADRRRAERAAALKGRGGDANWRVPKWRFERDQKKKDRRLLKERKRARSLDPGRR